MPPAFPPRRPARSPEPSGARPQVDLATPDGAPVHGGSAENGLLVEVDLLAWTLLFDHGAPTDRSSRAMLERAARLATGAWTRAV